ncbi:MAG: carboxyl transferase domain-containing protein [Myxococcota bacterium]
MAEMASVQRIAILNRGEAATRCLRAIRELRTQEGSDLVGIALYTDPDRFAAFVRDADEAISLGPALRRVTNGPERPAYLDRDRVLAALRAMRVDSVWPGWGFLAEDPAFVEKLEATGLIFLGPRAETMRLLGNKIRSKQLAEAVNVPVVPWSGGPIERADVLAHAERVGFPLMLKAAAGGGGRGIRLVRDAAELGSSFDSAGGEAAHAFGDATLFLESRIGAARHVEVQLAADQHGGVLALGLRDCSVQRRHQKVIEEAPPPGLSPDLVEEMREASIRLLRKAGYVGVATVEFLLAGEGSLYFLEVNPRLQVEHGITELLNGFDLVKWQIRIARGDRLPGTAPAARGCSMEVRLCAEDPSADFAPSPGQVTLLELPSGPGIRVDAGVTAGDTIPAEFDSMIAKIMAHGSSREEARARLERAVSDVRVVIQGGMTNKGFLLDVLRHPGFRGGGIDTGWLAEAGLASAPQPCIEALLVAAIHVYQREREAVRANFYAEGGRPQKIPPSTGAEVDLVFTGTPYRLTVYAIGNWSYRVHLGDRVAQVRVLEPSPHTRTLFVGDRRHQVLLSESEVELRIEIDGRHHRVQQDIGGKVRAPAPALVIELAVQPGESVAAGQRLGLLEAMKTETAFFAPLAGTVREVIARAGERVSAGDVILVIEPSFEKEADAPPNPPLELAREADPLGIFFDPEGQLAPEHATEAPAAQRAAGIASLRSETRRVLMGYDVNPERAERLVQVLEAPVESFSEVVQTQLAQLAGAVEVFADIETLFDPSPTRIAADELGPSNDARMAMYLRRIGAEGAGIDAAFLELVRGALSHYDVHSLQPSDALERAVLRVYATRTTLGLRARLIVALLHMLIRLGERGETFSRQPELAGALDRLTLLRDAVSETVADLSAQARYALFDRAAEAQGQTPSPPVFDLAHTLVPPPDPEALEQRARELGLSLDLARRIELWRLDEFELEPIEIERFEDMHAFYARSRDDSSDARILCFAEITDIGRDLPQAPDRARFEQRFHEAIEAMRSIRGQRDAEHRLQWNRLYLFVRPALVLTDELLQDLLRRLSPETGRLGLEWVVVRLASVDPTAADAPAKMIEVLAGTPGGTRVEWSIREPHLRPLQPATPAERRMAAARARGLIYPYEICRLFTAEPEGSRGGIGRPTGPGVFEEYDLYDGKPVRVVRDPGDNECAIVFGIITTPTLKHPEGMRRVIVIGDPTRGMGALAAPECDRIVAALDLAEHERLPVEWVGLSSGARIAMDSGTENLDATARVVRRLVTFTDAGGEVNLILPGVNVGAQSYFDALATMSLQSRGVLIMLPRAFMVLTGRAALEFSGGVAAEDEVGIGGYERIMGPGGHAHYQARDLADAYGILLDHYACSYRAPGEPAPRRFQTKDPDGRDVTLSPYEGEEDFESIGDIFSREANPERKRPFAMRPLMRSVIDQDAGTPLERWPIWRGAETAIVWDSHLGGYPITLIGIESRPVPRLGYTPNDGPDSWTAGTLFPASSKKVARALNAASGNRPVVILANLSGFDGSPESMRRGILEFGAEIARAVVRFDGKLVFTVVSRYHGGAYVVFSRELNDGMHAVALSGSYASVIGGGPAAAVVFGRDVRRRAEADPRVREARARVDAAPDAPTRVALRARLDREREEVTLEKQAEIAAEFDAIHTVERAREVGSLEAIIEPEALRPALIGWLKE